MTNPNKDKPIMYILAGPNGSGKSSVLTKKIPENIVALNADKFAKEIAKERGIPDDKAQDAVDNSEALQLAGMRRLKNLMRQALKTGETFSAETVLNLGAYKDYIKDAKSNGFEVELLYIGLNSPMTNRRRVDIRVAKGGHSVKPENIINRYYGSLERLHFYIIKADRGNRGRTKAALTRKAAPAVGDGVLLLKNIYLEAFAEKIYEIY